MNEYFFWYRDALLLSSPVASHSSGFCSLLSKPHLLTRPHLSFSSPKEKRRCCITTPNFITTTSTLYLYSTLSMIPVFIGFFEKRGLCVASLPYRRRFRGAALPYSGFALSKLSVDIGCGAITIPSLRLPIPEKTIFSPACTPLSTK